MIIFPSQGLIFIHSPRTGGTSLNFAIRQIVPDAIVRSHGVAEQHMRAATARAHYPGHDLVTITRNPWDVYASIYRMARRVAQDRDTSFWQPHALDNVLAWSRLSFSQFLLQTVGRDTFRLSHAGGFTASYADAYTTILRYDEHPFRVLGVLLGAKVEVKRENAGVTDVEIPWMAWMVDLVGEQCHIDVERFGYRPPDVR